MPYAVPRLCPRCRSAHSGPCPQRKQRDQERASAAKRGYDRRWRAFRDAYINTVVANDPFCQDCRGPFVHRSEIELHHMRKVADQPELRFDAGNVKHLCKACHTKRTLKGE